MEVVLVLVSLAVFVRLIAGSLDADRIDAYLKERDCEVLDKSWAPFGKGWFGDQHNRIYRIVYRTAQGETRRATVKTSLFAGVYLTDDRAVTAD